ncbi:hypothetical protein EV426DRAFT_711345 [Tirmania nivea]|nr:hypothetical protein EV426DRAFT_711345 [Tirmania nivea]
MFASGINKNTKKFAPKITQRRKPGGPTPTPTPSSGPSDASIPTARTLPAESLLAPTSVQDETANPEVPISKPLSPRPPSTSRTSLTPAPTPIPSLVVSHHSPIEAPTSTVGPSNESKTPVPPIIPQTAGQQHQQSRELTQEIDVSGSPTQNVSCALPPPVVPAIQSSSTPVPTIQETATIALTVQASPVIPVAVTEIAVPTSVSALRSTPTLIPTVQATPVPVLIAPPSGYPTVFSTASTVITPQPIPEDPEPRKRRRFNATKPQYTPQGDEDEEMEDGEELDDDRDKDYEEEVRNYKPTAQEGGTIISDGLYEVSFVSEIGNTIAASINSILSAANSGANIEAESEARTQANGKNKGKTTAKTPAKPRPPRKKKTETETAGGTETSPSAPKKARAPRKSKKQPAQAPEAEAEEEASAAANTDGEASPAVRRRGRKREATPPNAESIQIAPGVVKMGDLCRDMKIGRKSKRFTELEKLDWTEVVRKQRAKKAALEAAKAAGEDIQPQESMEERLERIAQENEAARPQSQRHAMQVRVVNGQIVLDEETLQVDRRELVQEDGPREIVEESSLTRRVNAGTWGKREKPERWDEASTDRFYEGLGMFGTDFELISGLFPDRSRRQIKNKFTAEERRNPARVTAALKNRVEVDIEEYSRVTNTEYGDARELDRELEEMRAQHEEEERATAEAVKELDRERREMQEAAAAAAAAGENVIGVVAPQKRRGKGKQSQFISRHQGGGEEVVLGLI